MNKGLLDIIYRSRQEHKKLISVLIDPDNRNFGQLGKLLILCNENNINFLLVGGSLLSEGNMEETISFIRKHSQIPIILFPGTTNQINNQADAIFLLSLVSGRNPEFLIGKQVESAFRLKHSGLEIISTAYLLIDSGRSTTASYISFTQPLPADKPMLSAATALASEQLGFKLLYLDAGSGAENSVSTSIIRSVAEHIEIPIIVGGGLRSKNDITNAFNAGADMVVIGTVLESNPEILHELL